MKYEILSMLKLKQMSSNQLAEALGIERTSPASRAWIVLGEVLDGLRDENVVGLAIDRNAPKEEARAVGPDSFVYYLKEQAD